MEFIILETDDVPASHAGLALAGALLQRTELQSPMDAGNDEETLRRPRKHRVDWIIKRNLRNESQEDWLTEAQAMGT